jgi:hypothetical protein
MNDHGDGLLLSTEFRERRLDSDLTLGEVADDAAGALAFLARGGEILRFLSRASVYYRVRLGLELMNIQKRRFWSQMERPVRDQLAHVCAFLRASVCNPMKTQGRFSVFEKV